MSDTPPAQSSDPEAPPSAEQAQEAIRQQLIEVEIKVRRWLESPAGRKTVETAKAAVPVAGAVGVALLAGAAVWFWRGKRQREMSLHDRVSMMNPMIESDEATLPYLRQTLVGRTEKQVSSLLGPAVLIEVVGDDAGRWIYPLSDDVPDNSPDQAAMAIDFNAEGRVEDVSFLMHSTD